MVGVAPRGRVTGGRDFSEIGWPKLLIFTLLISSSLCGLNTREPHGSRLSSVSVCKLWKGDAPYIWIAHMSVLVVYCCIGGALKSIVAQSSNFLEQEFRNVSVDQGLLRGCSQMVAGLGSSRRLLHSCV